MERYIEVIGEGQFVETVSRFIADVTVGVRAAKNETAFREVAELCAEAVAVLRESGLSDGEIVEGGTDFRAPWYWKEKLGQNATRKIILKGSDFGRLNLALMKLEPLQSPDKERRTITVDMRQPEFESSREAKASALAQAFEDAAAKAFRLATAMKCKLGKPIHIEEGGWAKRNSGFSGDEDWEGDYSRFAASGGGAVPEREPELEGPTRTIFVTCRVRFAVDDS